MSAHESMEQAEHAEQLGTRNYLLGFNPKTEKWDYSIDMDPTDVVLRITTSAICGSDLHQYHGRGAAPGAPPLVEPGSVMGHEFMGVVEEVGASVARVKKGDRIVAPFSISCGQCEWCRMRLPTQCATTGRALKCRT